MSEEHDSPKTAPANDYNSMPGRTTVHCLKDWYAAYGQVYTPCLTLLLQEAEEVSKKDAQVAPLDPKHFLGLNIKPSAMGTRVSKDWKTDTSSWD